MCDLRSFFFRRTFLNYPQIWELAWIDFIANHAWFMQLSACQGSVSLEPMEKTTLIIFRITNLPLPVSHPPPQAPTQKNI